MIVVSDTFTCLPSSSLPYNFRFPSAFHFTAPTLRTLPFSSLLLYI